MSDAIAPAIALISFAVAGGIAWIAFCVGMGLGTALENASIRIVWHKHSKPGRAVLQHEEK